MYKVSDIAYEIGEYWVLGKGAKGFEVYRTGVTHSTRCAIIGFTGDIGLQKAKAEADRRYLAA